VTQIGCTGLILYLDSLYVKLLNNQKIIIEKKNCLNLTYYLIVCSNMLLECSKSFWNLLKSLTVLEIVGSL